MQTPNLQLSHIALKEHHYMAEPTSHYNFQLEPITHKPKIANSVQQKMRQRQKQLQIRKQLLQSSQKVRRQMLVQKIEAKNERFDLRKKYEKQNIRSPQIPCFLKAKNKLHNQNHKSSQKSKQFFDYDRFQTGQVHKIYTNQQKVPFYSSKGFLRNTGGFESMRKQYKMASDDRVFKQIKLRAVKLPQLNSMGQKANNQKQGNELVMGQVNEGQQKRKLTKALSEEVINPLLKIHDTRYFGIEERSEDFQKIGKSLLKQIRNKYWCYDSLEDEEVYNNFEEILLDEMA